MKKICLIIFLLLSAIFSFIDLYPHFKMFIKFLSIYQIADIILKCSYIFLILGYLSSLIYNKKMIKFVIKLFLVLVLLSLSIDFFNSYFELRVVAKKLFLLLFAINYLASKKTNYNVTKKYNFNIIKYINLYIFSSIGFVIELYEKLRLSYFKKNFLSIQNFLGLSLILIFILIITNKKKEL